LQPELRSAKVITLHRRAWWLLTIAYAKDIA
jgi:hypothetical protein